MVFVTSATYVEVVARVREILKWMDSRNMVELEGRYDVGSVHKTRMKKMSIKCKVDWEAYQEIVAATQDESLELFATTVEVDRLHIYLNQCPPTVVCDKPRCTWTVRARLCRDGRWRIISCEAHHMCKKYSRNLSMKHCQLTSPFIA
jgi:hypothetical protein